MTVHTLIIQLDHQGASNGMFGSVAQKTSVLLKNLSHTSTIGTFTRPYFPIHPVENERITDYYKETKEVKRVDYTRDCYMNRNEIIK